MAYKPREKYDTALKALEDAFEACYNHPARDLLGMSNGPFSGVNVALGIIADLEENSFLLGTKLMEIIEEIKILRKEIGVMNEKVMEMDKELVREGDSCEPTNPAPAADAGATEGTGSSDESAKPAGDSGEGVGVIHHD